MFNPMFISYNVHDNFATLPPVALIFRGRSVQFVNPQALVELFVSMFFLMLFHVHLDMDLSQRFPPLLTFDFQKDHEIERNTNSWQSRALLIC